MVMVKITQEMDLDPYIGGELEVQDKRAVHTIRGRVKSITLDGETLRFQFAWLAQGRGTPPIEWKVAECKEHTVFLPLCHVYAIGLSDVKFDSNRICFNIVSHGEHSVLFLPRGSKLDQDKVKGLPHAWERLLALYPNLPFDCYEATKALTRGAWVRMQDVLRNLLPGSSLQDLLKGFHNASSAEEFLWYYIEGVTGEKNVCKKVY